MDESQITYMVIKLSYKKSFQNLKCIFSLSKLVTKIVIGSYLTFQPRLFDFHKKPQMIDLFWPGFPGLWWNLELYLAMFLSDLQLYRKNIRIIVKIQALGKKGFISTHFLFWKVLIVLGDFGLPEKSTLFDQKSFFSFKPLFRILKFGFGISS